MSSALSPSGIFSGKSIVFGDLPVEEQLKQGMPSLRIPRHIAEWREENLPNLLRGADDLIMARKFGLRIPVGSLHAKIFRANGEVDNLGLVSLRVVTNSGVAAIVDAFQGLFTLSNFKYHGLGTSNTAEAATDSALGAELTTEYSTDNQRATGTTAENAANIFETVATVTVDADNTGIYEHGIFSQAASPGGTLLDRSVIALVTLNNGDGYQGTYRLTIPSGS